MIQSERKAIQSFRKRLCARSIAASRAALKQSYRFLQREHIKRDLLCPSAPIRKARRNTNSRPCGRQQVGNLFWARNVVVNEEPSRALFRQSAQRSRRRLLNIS